LSTQEERFAQIAAAIREKDGSTEPIKALDFAARILAIPTGGGAAAGFAVPLVVTVDTSAEVTAVNGDITVSGTTDADNIARLILTAPGIWTVTAKQGDKEKSEEIEVIDGYASLISLLGRLPAGYTELEYIHWEGNCTSFELLETVNCYTDKLLLVIYPESYGTSSQYLMAFLTAVGSTNYFISLSANTNGNLRYSVNKTASVESTVPIINVLLTCDLDFKSNTYTVNGTTLSGVRANRNLGNGYKNLGCRSLSTSFSAKAKFYHLTHYRDGEIIHEYVPCMNSDGVCGIFDVNTETFIKNTHPTPTAVTTGPAV